MIFAEPKSPEVVEIEQRSGIEDESPEALTYESKIRIILENKTNLEYVVGFLGDNIPFTASMENMFNRMVSSASWLKFKRIGKKMNWSGFNTQQTFISLKSTMETLEKTMTYVQS